MFFNTCVFQQVIIGEQLESDRYYIDVESLKSELQDTKPPQQEPVNVVNQGRSLAGDMSYLPPANVVCEGFVFTGVCLSTGGAIPACIAGGIPACLAAWWVPGPGGVPGPRGSAPGGGGDWSFCYGLLLWSSVMAFWFGGLLIEGGLLVWSSGGPEGHNRRPPHQKAITEGGVPGGDPPGRLLLWAVRILLECILSCSAKYIRIV